MALGFLGTGLINPINTNNTTTTKSSYEANICEQYWDLTRKTVLRDFPYSFAQRREYLALVLLDEEYENQYKYAYALPDNCLKIHEIYTEYYNSFANHNYEIVQQKCHKPCLLCNIYPCILAYTTDIDEDYLPFVETSFIEMLAYKLAFTICTPLLKDNTVKLQQLNQLYQMALAQAMQNDSSSRKRKMKKDSWIGIMSNN